MDYGAWIFEDMVGLRFNSYYNVGDRLSYGNCKFLEEDEKGA